MEDGVRFHYVVVSDKGKNKELVERLLNRGRGADCTIFKVEHRAKSIHYIIAEALPPVKKKKK